MYCPIVVITAARDGEFRGHFPCGWTASVTDCDEQVVRSAFGSHVTPITRSLLVAGLPQLVGAEYLFGAGKTASRALTATSPIVST